MPPRNDITFRSARPREKPFKLSDSGGLFLLVQPNAAKLCASPTASTGSKSC